MGERGEQSRGSHAAAPVAPVCRCRGLTRSDCLLRVKNKIRQRSQVSGDRTEILRAVMSPWRGELDLEHANDIEAGSCRRLTVDFHYLISSFSPPYRFLYARIYAVQGVSKSEFCIHFSTFPG